MSKAGESPTSESPTSATPGEGSTLSKDRAEGTDVREAVPASPPPSRIPGRELYTWMQQWIPPAHPGDLTRFIVFFSVLRWASLALALVIGLSKGRIKETLLGAALLALVALGLTLRPARYDRGGWTVSAGLLAEVALGIAIVEMTGFSNSPFLITLCGATTIAGFAGGVRILSAVAVLAGLSVAVPTILLSQSILFPHDATSAASIQLATLIVLVAGVAGYCRYLVEDTGQLKRGLTAQVEHLSTMNGLLLDLHAAAEQLATPFDLDGATRWLFDRLEGQFPADVVAVLLCDPVTGDWNVAEAKGIRLPTDQSMSLPSTLLAATRAYGPVVAEHVGAGLSGQRGKGLYHALRSHGELLGMLVVESAPGAEMAARPEQMLGELATAGALAIGNARWLQRLRVLSVEQERTRLARDLHDRISQSVVYLGLEVDRLAQVNMGRAVQDDLMDLRRGLSVLTAELRDTLVDLRSDPSEETDVATLLQAFIERVNRRGEVVALLRTECSRRLPTMVEHEIWQIGREAVVNAERHSRADHVSVYWTCNEDGALLEVIDDGVGLPGADQAHADATSGYGMLGMQERADAIRATLEIDSRLRTGTVVRLRWSAS